MQGMYHLNQIPSQAQICKFLRRILFGKNAFCPQCHSQRVAARQGRYHCRQCRSRFSLLSHTWLPDLKLSLPKFWLLLWAWCQQIPVAQAMSLTLLSEEAVRRWYGRFRLHLPENPLILKRIVQLDEAYGKHWTLMMAKEKGTRKLAYEFVSQPRPERHHAVAFLSQHVKPRSRLYTDSAFIYRGIEHWWPVRHRSDVHAKWQFGKTTEIEGLFGNLRTFLRRMYHHVPAESMPEYVREFCARFSLPELFENPNNYLSKTLSLVPLD